jgi:3-oxoacyl-[acyl-carrier protein] reductase
MEIRDQVAIVTGAGSGLGRATAVALAQAGARAVVIADIDVAGAGATADLVKLAGAEPLVVPTDLAELEQLRRLFGETEKHFGRLDILVNNAAIAEGEVDWPDVDPEQAARVVDVNLRGTILATRLAIDVLARFGGGRILNVASGGAFQPSLPQAAYVGTKAGIVHFSRSCEGLKESHGIHVSCLCPGMIDTPGFAKLDREGGRPAWLQASVDAYEMLQPEEVAAKLLEVLQDPECAGKVEIISGGPKAG